MADREHCGSVVGRRQHGTADNPPLPDGHDRRRRTWVNWTLALLTVPGAGMVMLLWLGR